MTKELQKAINTTSTLNAGGLMNPEQFKKFLSLVKDESKLLKKVNVRDVKNKAGELDRLYLDGRKTVPSSEATDPAVRKEFSTDKIEYSTKKVMLPFEISNETFEDNIEKEDFEDTILNVFATQFSNDIEELMIAGDKDSTDPYLALIDGWLETAKNSGNVIDHAGSTIGANLSELLSLVANMIKAIPRKYRRNASKNFEIMVDSDTYIDIKSMLANRETQSGDAYLDKDKVPYLLGYKVEEYSIWTPDYTYNSTEGHTSLFLGDPKNLNAIFHRNIKLAKDEDIYADTRQYAMTSRVDGNIEIPEATVLVQNVKRK